MNKDLREKIHVLVSNVLEVENNVRTNRERRLANRISQADTKQAGITKKMARLRRQKMASEERENRQIELKRKHRDTLSRRGLI